MKFITLSQHEAENVEVVHPDIFDRTEKYPIISITGPEKPNADLKETGFLDILRLEFHDIDQEIDGIEVEMFNQEHAKKIKDFVEKHQNCDIMFIHCLAGESRSTGVASALNLILNDDKEIKFSWRKYNSHVYSTLLQFYRGIEKSEDYYNNLFGE